MHFAESDEEKNHKVTSRYNSIRQKKRITTKLKKKENNRKLKKLGLLQGDERISNQIFGLILRLETKKIFIRSPNIRINWRTLYCFRLAKECKLNNYRIE